MSEILEGSLEFGSVCPPALLLGAPPVGFLVVWFSYSFSNLVNGHWEELKLSVPKLIVTQANYPKTRVFNTNSKRDHVSF